MNEKEFNELIVKPTLENIQKLMVVKGGEYAGSADRLANFKRGSKLTGCTSLQVLFIYLSKHYDAVATYVRDQSAGVERPRSESIDGRIDDIINYCILLKGLVYEAEVGEKSGDTLTAVGFEEWKRMQAMGAQNVTLRD